MGRPAIYCSRHPIAVSIYVAIPALATTPPVRKRVFKPRPPIHHRYNLRSLSSRDLSANKAKDTFHQLEL
jgi:hypothetical protein